MDGRTGGCLQNLLGISLIPGGGGWSWQVCVFVSARTEVFDQLIKVQPLASSASGLYRCFSGCRARELSLRGTRESVCSMLSKSISFPISGEARGVWDCPIPCFH